MSAQSVSTALAIALGGFWVGIAAMHAYWGVGGKWFTDRTYPHVPGQRIALPGKLACWAVTPVFLGFAWISVSVGGLAGVGPGAALPELSPGWVLIAGHALAAICLLRAIGEFRYVGFFKRVRGTAFAWWDTRLYSPLCLIVGLATEALVLLQG
jgi:hypothetical protein